MCCGRSKKGDELLVMILRPLYLVRSLKYEQVTQLKEVHLELTHTYINWAFSGFVCTRNVMHLESVSDFEASSSESWGL